MQKKDYSHLNFNDRIKIGAQVYQNKIIELLKENQIHIEPAKDYHTDAILKIDGHLNGDKNQPVQIKHRRTTQKSRNDLAYEVCRNHNSSKKLLDQINIPHQQGRDLKGTSVVHYFLMNCEETEIYHLSALIIKEKITEAINEHLNSDQKGYLKRKYIANNKIELIATKDNDKRSFTPYKVMAFIPISKICLNKYQVK